VKTDSIPIPQPEKDDADGSDEKDEQKFFLDAGSDFSEHNYVP
jgi:hypothetical protein